MYPAHAIRRRGGYIYVNVGDAERATSRYGRCDGRKEQQRCGVRAGRDWESRADAEKQGGTAWVMVKQEPSERWCVRSVLPVHLDLAMSRAALMSGASVRRGSESLKKACCPPGRRQRHDGDGRSAKDGTCNSSAASGRFSESTSRHAARYSLNVADSASGFAMVGVPFVAIR